MAEAEARLDACEVIRDSINTGVGAASFSLSPKPHQVRCTQGARTAREGELCQRLALWEEELQTLQEELGVAEQVAAHSKRLSNTHISNESDRHLEVRLQKCTEAMHTARAECEHVQRERDEAALRLSEAWE